MRVTPILIQRDGPGGWLAISPPDSNVRIGVVGADENDAAAQFAASLERWDQRLSEALND